MLREGSWLPQLRRRWGSRLYRWPIAIRSGPLLCGSGSGAKLFQPAIAIDG